MTQETDGLAAPMIPVAEARLFVLSACKVLTPVQLDVHDAHGHVLGENVLATTDVPPFDNSSMDGYAVRAADTASAPVSLRVVASVMAGDDARRLVSPGESVRIMTGAPLPPGADAVCMVERTRLESGGSIVVVEESVEPGTFVRRAGGDVRAGDEVFSPGTYLGAAHVGVLSSIGVERLLVHPSPTVGVLSTGDELATSSGPLAPGKIRDANRPALLAQLRADGFGAVDLGVAGDDEAALTTLLEEAGCRCDAIVSSGGVSVGDLDLMKAVLHKLSGPTMRWMQVAIKPAKPFAFGVLEKSGTPVFGLPGNPVSALVSYELFVRPALRSMAGCTVLDRPRLAALAEVDLPRRPDGKLHLIRVSARTGTDGELGVRMVGGQDSHMLHVMAQSNALALVPDGDGVRAGQRVEVLLLDTSGMPAARREPW
ncbi:MAG: gephyrin-like molybdotransferase Glp [Acidimicrobiales bacterium]